MALNTLWFILIGVLFAGYFFLEGFDYGVGMLVPILGKDDEEKRIIINSIGPFWDGNEVWLITAGGAMFAAFPEWYASLFSTFYLALALMLIGLIFRGVAFEFRSKEEDKRWRMFWDMALAGGSAITSLLWGVAFANLIQGVALGEGGIYQGTFFDHLSLFSVSGGVFTLLLFLLHGALFLTLKVDLEIATRAEKATKIIWPLVMIAGLTFLLLGITTINRTGADPTIPIILGLGFLIASGILTYVKRNGWSFAALGLSIAMFVIAVFTHMFPRVMISNLDPAFSMTIQNASASAVTLQTMTKVAVVLLPIVIAYQGWTYWVFRERVTKKSHLEY